MTKICQRHQTKSNRNNLISKSKDQHTSFPMMSTPYWSNIDSNCSSHIDSASCLRVRIPVVASGLNHTLRLYSTKIDECIWVYHRQFYFNVIFGKTLYVQAKLAMNYKKILYVFIQLINDLIVTNTQIIQC